MALELSLSSREQNDNTTLILTDDAGTYDAGSNPTGWGTPNVAPADIDGTTHTLTLDVDITTADSITTSYDQIDLYDEFNPNGGFTDTGDLVFNITPALLLVSGSALGAATDELPDGLYALTYSVDEGLGTEDIYTDTVLVYGVVKVLVYEKLADIPTAYMCNECSTNKVIKEADLYGAYLYSIETWDYSAKDEEVLSMLNALNNMVINGSSIAW